MLPLQPRSHARHRTVLMDRGRLQLTGWAALARCAIPIAPHDVVCTNTKDQMFWVCLLQAQAAFVRYAGTTKVAHTQNTGKTHAGTTKVAHTQNTGKKHAGTTKVAHSQNTGKKHAGTTKVAHTQNTGKKHAGTTKKGGFVTAVAPRQQRHSGTRCFV
eukprot:365477-Chlamydomonas_euryale.AAC.6